MRRRPLGFVLLSLALGALALLNGGLLVFRGRGAESLAETLIAVLAIAWTTLLGVTAVALWRVERWAGTAVTCTLLAPLVGLLAALMIYQTHLGMMVVLMAPYALVAAILLLYVRLRLEAIYPTSSAARPAARRRWP
jgi:phosphatidylserine synthase